MMINKFKYVTSGEDGTSTMEIIVQLGVVLVICSFLIVFGNAIIGFAKSSASHIGGSATNKTWHVDQTPRNITA